MTLSPRQRTARTLRAIVIPAALLLGGGAANAGLLDLVGAVLAPITGLVTTVLQPTNQAYFAQRDAQSTAAGGSRCRGKDLHLGVERVSYGSGSPKARQLINDCTPQIAFAPPAP